MRNKYPRLGYFKGLNTLGQDLKKQDVLPPEEVAFEFNDGEIFEFNDGTIFIFN